MASSKIVSRAVHLVVLRSDAGQGEVQALKCEVLVQVQEFLAQWSPYFEEEATEPFTQHI